jgi:hypothetical protein
LHHGAPEISLWAPRKAREGIARFRVQRQRGGFVEKTQHWFVAAVAALLLLLYGCATPVVPINFSVPNVGLSKKKIDAEVKSLTVTVAPANEATGTQNINTAMVTPLWTSAMNEAFNKMAIFQDDAPMKVNVSVKILSFDPPSVGFSMTTKTSARYEIVDRKSGDIIHTQDVSSSHTTPADFAFNARIRINDSINHAVQDNIIQFLQALESVDIRKPMFPAKTGASK